MTRWSDSCQQVRLVSRTHEACVLWTSLKELGKAGCSCELTRNMQNMQQCAVGEMSC